MQCRRSRLLVGVAVLIGISPSVAQEPLRLSPIATFLQAASADQKQAEPALAALSRTWQSGYAAMLIDLARFMVSPRGEAVSDLPRTVDLMGDDERRQGADRSLGAGYAATIPSRAAVPARQRLIALLERKTGRRFGDDLGQWRQWLWSQPYVPHPEYLAFKAAVYGRVDPRMAKFFTGGATVRLDEIDWGGVKVNGIPPLVSPKNIPAAAAAWLKDTHVIFGVDVGGEARAYPKRILAWHEMALDRLGGVDLTMVYCTLCGTVIPYESLVAGVRRTFGTSGLLYRSNKLMFDAETMSLWSTLEGGPVVGPLAGSGLRLQYVPVVTTTWAEWRRDHPETSVLSLDTGHERDYSEGAAYREYFSSDRLMFRVPFTDKRLQNKDEILGLLLPAHGGGRQAVALSAAFLLKHPVYHAAFEGQRLVILTSPKGANRVYDSGPHEFAAWQGETRVADRKGQFWKVTEDALISEATGARLARRAAFRAFWFGWHAQFPDTELVK